jgi:hypothetical protein
MEKVSVPEVPPCRIKNTAARAAERCRMPWDGEEPPLENRTLNGFKVL